MKTTFFFFSTIYDVLMSSTSSGHHLLDMTVLSKLSLFRTELIIFLPIPNPWIDSSFQIWVYISFYSVLHSDSGRLRVTLIFSSSTKPRTAVDSNSSLSPISLPLLVFSSWLLSKLKPALVVRLFLSSSARFPSFSLTLFHPIIHLDVRQIFLICRWHHITPISNSSVASHYLYDWLFRFL